MLLLLLLLMLLMLLWTSIVGRMRHLLDKRITNRSLVYVSVFSLSSN
jgi:hypothetical protein